MTQSNIYRNGATVFVSVKLTIIPAGLSSAQQNSFFVVIPSTSDKVVKVNQWLSTTDANTVVVAVQYQNFPASTSTLFIALNAAILSTSYANVGYTATENSFLSVVISSSIAPAPSTLTIPATATNSAAGSVIGGSPILNSIVVKSLNLGNSNAN
jgi:hypothetical protein